MGEIEKTLPNYNNNTEENKRRTTFPNITLAPSADTEPNKEFRTRPVSLNMSKAFNEAEAYRNIYGIFSLY